MCCNPIQSAGAHFQNEREKGKKDPYARPTDVIGEIDQIYHGQTENFAKISHEKSMPMRFDVKKRTSNESILV